MNRLKKYRPVIAQAYDPLCETTTAFDVINKRLTRLIQPTQKAAQLILTLAGRIMKKRLRKKKHEGEFQEFGFEVSFGLLAGLAFEERNAVLDAFITEAIEANGLQFGGGGTTTWEGFIALDKPRGSATEDHRSGAGKGDAERGTSMILCFTSNKG